MIASAPPMTVDHEAEEPVYLQIAGILRARILSGELEPGRPVPSEETLRQTFEVARETARKAVRVLRSEGLVRTRQGKGTFVTRPEERG